MTAALSLLSASALAIALLVPLRDDRRGNRATIGGNAPLRPFFPASDSAPADGDETVPSAVSIRFTGDEDAHAPVDVTSPVARDAPESAAPVASGDPEPTNGVTETPARGGGFTFRSLAAALGFHRAAERRAGPGETGEPKDDSVGHETIAPDAAASDAQRSFAEEVERLSGVPPYSANDAPVQISAMPDAGEAGRLFAPASGATVATVDASAKPVAEAGESSTVSAVLAMPDAMADDHVRGSTVAAAGGADAQTQSANVPATQEAGTEAATPRQAGANSHADADGAAIHDAAGDITPRVPHEEANAFAASGSQEASIPIDRMRPPLTRLPLRPKREDISWPRSLSEANGEWTEATRHDFLRRAAERTDPELERVLCAAFREETAAGRLLALRALVRGSAAGTHAIFIEALRRGADEERALAVDVFGERGDRAALVEALSDRLDAIAARAALACFGMSSRADLERALTPLVDRARSDAIVGLLAGVLQ